MKGEVMDIFLFLMLLMLGHWIGDFVLQSDRIALGKSEQAHILAEHCLVYSGVMGLYLFLIGAGNIPIVMLGMFYLWMFFTHFAIDFVTARANKKLWMNNQRHWFFVMVGFDQFLHMCTILIYIKMMIATGVKIG
jgi:hypothetical protein